MKRKFIILVPLCFALIIACSNDQQQSSCRDYFGNVSVSLPFEQLDSSNMVDWVTNTFRLKSSDIAIATSASDSTITWKAAAIFYRASFSESGQLQRVAVGWEGVRKPNIRTVLNCLGSPSSFSALTLPSMSKGKVVEFNMNYAGRGMVFGATLDLITTVPDTTQLDLFFVEPGTDSEVMVRLYPYDRSGVFVKSLRPWPAQIEDLSPSEAKP